MGAMAPATTLFPPRFTLIAYPRNNASRIFNFRSPLRHSISAMTTPQGPSSTKTVRRDELNLTYCSLLSVVRLWFRLGAGESGDKGEGSGSVLPELDDWECHAVRVEGVGAQPEGRLCGGSLLRESWCGARNGTEVSTWPSRCACHGVSGFSLRWWPWYRISQQSNGLIFDHSNQFGNFPPATDLEVVNLCAPILFYAVVVYRLCMEKNK